MRREYIFRKIENWYFDTFDKNNYVNMEAIVILNDHEDWVCFIKSQKNVIYCHNRIIIPKKRRNPIY